MLVEIMNTFKSIHGSYPLPPRDGDIPRIRLEKCLNSSKMKRDEWQSLGIEDGAQVGGVCWVGGGVSVAFVFGSLAF